MVEMSDWDHQDSLTNLNTQLNKSMILMENVIETSQQQNKSSKSIKISTKAKPRNSKISPNNTHRKSILKKPENLNIEEGSNNDKKIDTDSETSANMSLCITTVTSSSRPYNLEELVEEETLTLESTSSILNISDISDSEDIWIMDIPKTVEPKELIGQTLVLGDKSKFKIGEEKYCAINRDLKHNITCVFNTTKAKSQYKAVNVKPVGSITIRKKLSGIPKVKPVSLENSSVPFPENVKMRHPLFGVISDSKSRKELKINGSRNRKKK